MARHFFRLYLILVAALAAIVWIQERLWDAFGPESAARNAPLIVAQAYLRNTPRVHRGEALSKLRSETQLDFELLSRDDIVGNAHAALDAGAVAKMQSEQTIWHLARLDADTVLALKEEVEVRRAFEWTLALVFYAAIALVIMIWLWPLTRDLKRLERATASFGNRNWAFNAELHRRSQVFSLAQTFRKMAARIDRLIASHKDLSNAVAHEIKTPLSRMQFAIEMAKTTTDLPTVHARLADIQTDVAALNALVHATLEYAVLERADFALNIGVHDFTAMIPALIGTLRKDASPELDVECVVDPKATAVRCDAHLMETLVRNLLYNAIRYARSRVRLKFEANGDVYTLLVEDNGPGIPEADRERVFLSFVQLPQSNTKHGFGLGLAIVKRIAEWHGGTATCGDTELGGARFTIKWSGGVNTATITE